VLVCDFATAATGKQNQTGANHLAAAATNMFEQSVNITRSSRRTQLLID
jgi:hypothetical protein